MALLFAVILLGLILENDYLLALAMLEHLALCGNTGKNGLADLNAVAVCDHEYVEINVCADLAVELLDHDLAANLNLVLFAAGYDDCVHYAFPPLTSLALGVCAAFKAQLLTVSENNVIII